MAPGRINIIGEHTDYAGGLCLPAAIDRYVAVAVSPATSLEVASQRHPGVVAARPTAPVATGGWADTILGVVAEVSAAAPGDGARISVVSDLPEGSGLSSSAAVSVATAIGLLNVRDTAMGAFDIARLCRRAENQFLGVPSGLMDQVACLLGRADTAILFHADVDLAETVPLEGDFAWLVCESGVDRGLRNTDYGRRPAEADEALRLARRRHMGLRNLAELSAQEVEVLDLPEPLLRRARHIAGETLRVRLAVACVEAGNVEALGQLITTSHRSLARDMEVSTPELDELVRVAERAGCAGARLLGAGFGGSVLVLADSDSIDGVAMSVVENYRTPEGEPPRVHRLHIVDGAMA